jgi:hypothetical protein
MIDKYDAILIRMYSSMLPLSYTASTDLLKLLHHIDALRATILLSPIAARKEHLLRWRAQVMSVHGSMLLAGIKLKPKDIEHILTQEGKIDAPVLFGYHHAQHWIEDTWAGSEQEITPRTLETLRDMVYVGPLSSRKRTHRSIPKSTHQLLSFIISHTDHPVVASGIAMGILGSAILPPDDPGLLARLVARVFLARAGYSLRGMTAIESQWAKEAPQHDIALSTISTHHNLNHWLLFFAQSVATHFETCRHNLHPDSPFASPRAPLLTRRQWEILHMVDNPEVSITNKHVQKRYRVSQITASRDLTRLTALGLLHSHGKGRSVSYTRA